MIWNLGFGVWDSARPLPPVSRQPEPELLERRRDGIRSHLHVAHRSPHVLPEPVRKRPAPFLVRAGIIESLAYPLGHREKVRVERLEVRPDIPDWAEVRQKHRFG